MTDDHEIRKSNHYALIGVVLTIASIALTIFVKGLIEVYSTTQRVVANEKRIDQMDKMLNNRLDAEDREIQILRDDVKQILLRDQPK